MAPAIRDHRGLEKTRQQPLLPEFLKKDLKALEPAGLKVEEWKGILNQGVSTEGKLTLKGCFCCDGPFKGAIECDGLLILGEHSQVEGRVSARQLSVRGRLKGTVRVREKMLILPTAMVTGDIYTECLIIEAGACFDGKSHMLKPESSQEQELTRETVQDEKRQPGAAQVSQQSLG